jgi:single-strand DNA-binding protein
MAKSVNNVMLLGYLGSDPEIRYTSGGTIVGEMRIATTERVKKGGDWVDETEWHTLKAFNRTAEICRDYLHKGSKVYIEGKLHTDKWQDKETGAARYKTEILVRELVLLGDRDDRPPKPERAKPERAPLGSWKKEAYDQDEDEVPAGVASTPTSVEISDDDIPF